MLSTLSFFCCLGRCYRRARCPKTDAGIPSMPFLSTSIPPPPPCQRSKVKHPTEMQKNSHQWLPRVRDVCRNYLYPAPTAHPDFQSLRSRTRPSLSPMAAEMSTLMMPPFVPSLAAERSFTCSSLLHIPRRESVLWHCPELGEGFGNATGT